MEHRVLTIRYLFIILSLLFYYAVALEHRTPREARGIFETKNESPTNNSQQQSAQNVKPGIIERRWISKLFLEAEIAFQMDPNVNTACKKDFDLYKLHLRNQSVWAVRMLESSEWPSVGIFSGMVAHFGNYDECLAVSAYDIKGQYCLAEAVYDYQDLLQNEPVEYPDQKISAWEALSMYQRNPAKVNRKKLNFAICVPSSCTANDLKISLNSTLHPLFNDHGLDILVDVSPIFCKMRKEPIYSQGYFIVRCFFAALLLFIILSTCCDIAVSAGKYQVNESESSTQFRDVYEAFSLFGNYKKMIKVNPKTDYAFLHCLKMLNLLIIIYGHRYIYFFGFPKFNAESAEQQYNTSSLELVHANVVDVFFMISGFLTFHFGLLPMMKGGILYLFMSILFRWTRMIPVFGILILFIIYVLPYTSEGPLWDHRIMNEVNKCKESWWANLLVVNNLIKTDQQCLLVSWYISVDIQLTIIGVILLFIFAKNKKIGIFAIVFALIAFAVVTFTVAYVNQFHGILRLYMIMLEEPRNDTEFTGFYVAPYTRAGPYVVGFLAGVAVKLMKEREIKFNNVQIYLISFLSILVSEGSQYYGWVFYEFNREYNRVESALYASVSRSLFVFAYAVLLCLYFTSGLGVFNKFSEWKGWVPFGRLTYSVFLVNTVIQLYHAASQKQPMPVLGKINLIWWAFGDILWSYVIGLFLYLFAEAPISNLSKLLQRQLIKQLMKPKPNERAKIIDSNIVTNTTKPEKIRDSLPVSVT